MGKYDWNAIRNKYITTNLTLKELSHQYNIPLITIAQHSAPEKWKAERHHHNQLIYDKSINKDIKDKSSTIEEERRERIRLLKLYIKRELTQLAEGRYSVKSREGISRAITEGIKTLELLEGRPSERIAGDLNLRGKTPQQIHAIILQRLTTATQARKDPALRS